MNSSSAYLALVGGWSFVAAMVLALLVGALVRFGYLQVLSFVVIEALLVFWVYTLWRLAA